MDHSSRGQQEPNGQNWPVIKQHSPPRTDPKQARIDSLEDQNRRLEVELKQERTGAASRAPENDEISAKVVELERSLDHAHRKILSLQPPHEISDERVKQAFDNLCENIKDFVRVVCGALTSIEDRFNVQYWTDQELRITKHHITEDGIALSKEFPKISTTIIMNAIFSLAYECAFREDSWGGLTERSEEKRINKLVEIMSTQRSFYNTSSVCKFQSGLRFAGNAQLRRWWSETFRALRGGEQWAWKRDKIIKSWQRRLHLMLQHFADENKKIKHARLRSQILEPAYLLCDMIKGSTLGYRFEFVANSSSANVFIETKDANLHKLVDARTGREGEIESVAGDRIGRLRLCIFPSLERVYDDDRKVCLSKAFVVIDKLSKMNKGSSMLMSETTWNKCANEAAIEHPVSPRKAASVGNDRYTGQEADASAISRQTAQERRVVTW